MNERKEILNETINIARETGKTILTYFQDAYSVTDKTPDNPVTDADIAADNLLRERLMRLLPGAGWLSEETTDNRDRLNRPYVWVVDPLDGTKEFILGIPEFAISIALVKDGQPILGVILNPPTGELYYAQNGLGTFLGGQKCYVSNQAKIDGAKINASRSERERGEFSPFEETFDIYTVGSIAYKLAQVAAGQFDGTWSLGPKHEWDICAGTLLIQEAGGITTDLDNQPFIFNQSKPKVNNIVATNGHLHEKVLRELSPFRYTSRTE